MAHLSSVRELYQSCLLISFDGFYDNFWREFTIVPISAPDPEYGFKKKLDLKKHGETKKPVKLKCKVDDPNARVKWYKDGVEIKPSDADYLMEVDDEGNVTLTIRKAELKDAGKYTCKIEEFGKEGENETSCQVTIGGNPPKKPISEALICTNVHIIQHTLYVYLDPCF